MQRLIEFFRSKDGSSSRDLGLLLVVFGFSFFQSLGRLPLLETDEGRYMEIPREMLERGDFITPTLNYVKYFEKPPLHYWINALSIKIFGLTEFAGRFSGVLWGILGIMLTYFLGRKLFGRREGLYGALVLGTSAGFLIQSRTNITDTTLTICLTAALAFFAIAIQDNEKKKGRYYYLFYIFAALAVLAKGLIGIVLPGAIVFCYLLITRRWSLLKEMRLPTGILLFLFVAAPWFVAVSAKNPEFARFFFIHEHFERFLTKVHGRYKPFWFYAPVLLGCMLPWSLFIPAAVGNAWKQRKAVGADARLFLVLWVLIIFAFFSKSNSKLVPYILPVYLPLAVLIGCAFVSALEQGIKSLKANAIAAGILLTLLGIAGLFYPFVAPKPQIPVQGSIIIGLCLLGLGIPPLVAVLKKQAVVLFCSMALFAYLFGLFAPPVIYAKIVQRKSSRELALLVREKAGKDAVVATFEYEQGLPFYAGRRVVVVGGRGELEFGSNLGDQSAWFIDLRRFVELWNSPRPVFALIQERELPVLKKVLTTPMKELGRQGRRILITNQ
ncbi:glycosyltransferase family 39 protein [Geotalea sp. SG265]|uniref:glycosyltransferase family 39 protein n=1 Tax=Geotalea sp. SG265 TaxID=2922867 RepID=UPI001FAE9E61|nr:glycosyltransferase family 39 protein [Geotalea sp. SG265]